MELRDNVTFARAKFITDIIDAHERHELTEEYLSQQLEFYEMEANLAVDGNLELVNTSNSYNSTFGAFPTKIEKWTLMQAMFFASTVCTTIGK